MRDSSSAPIRISEAAVASLVQRYCRNARTASSATIPESIRGQKLRSALRRRRGESLKSGGLFVNGDTPYSQPEPANRIGTGMTCTYSDLCGLRISCELGELLSGQTTVNLFADWTYSRMPTYDCQEPGT